MIKNSTPHETSFLLELAKLMDKYAVHFSATGKDEMEITVYKTDEETGELDESAYLPISFHSVFDENDIYDLCLQTRDNIERIIKEYTPEKYGSGGCA